MNYAEGCEHSWMYDWTDSGYDRQHCVLCGNFRYVRASETESEA